MDVDLDIDIWGYGRDSAQAGRFTTQALKAAYPHVEVPESWVRPSVTWGKLLRVLNDHFEPNHNDQRVFMTWVAQTPAYVFFQYKEDAELFRALLYIY